jgi:uroporphyrinogen decarboxylase
VLPVTAKERVLCAISHRQPDRVPVDFGAHPQVVASLRQYLGLPQDSDLHRVFETDLRAVGPRIKWKASPIAYADPTKAVTDDGLYIDLWGVGFRPAQTPTGAYIDIAHHPLSDLQGTADLDRHEYMRPDDWDYSHVRADAEAQSEYAVWGHCRGTFEISWFIRGMDGFMLDLALEPARACGLMDRVQEPLRERMRRILAAAGDAMDILEYNDDVGTQAGLMMSPDMWRKYLKPRVAEMFGIIRDAGKHVRYHSCGGVRDILPDLIDIGLEILTPFQPLAKGMEPAALKRDFGRHLTFHGGIDMQELLPHASVNRVREETHRLLDVLNRDGGWIACSSHNLQPDTPPDNIVAMYEVLLGHEISA